MSEKIKTAESNNEIENQEIMPVVARNLIDCFGWRPERESFQVIVDSKVLEVNSPLVQAVREELDKRKGPKGYYRVNYIPASHKSATAIGEFVGEKMKDGPVLILTSMSRSHSPETGMALHPRITEDQKQRIADTLRSDRLARRVGMGQSAIDLARAKEMLEEGRLEERLKELALQRRSRLISITKAHNPFDILTKGAVLEPIENIRQRVEKVDRLMSSVAQVHITTAKGTDLWLAIDPTKKEMENGRVINPGDISNYPIGEWACSPKWQASSGTLVIDGPCGGNINLDRIDQPIRLEFRDGLVIQIQGGQGAEELKKYLNSGNNEQNGAYHLAELGIGVNTKAVEDKPPEDWGSTETEKKYGTGHIAVGSNTSFGWQPGDPNYNSVPIHCDMVILDPTLEIECTNQDGSKFFLIKNGQPQGY